MSQYRQELLHRRQRGVRCIHSDVQGWAIGEGIFIGDLDAVGQYAL
ncbi:MAG: hypothetical protein SD837_16965 [Candidatus Electrothrix scaldis]|nr:MAG: hypothetical protein SD837_16965 [Candidatus Electrothrix sp. GW3-3]